MKKDEVKVRCVMSHEIPLGGGKFRRYTAGEIYTLKEGELDPLFFAPVALPPDNKKTKEHKEVTG